MCEFPSWTEMPDGTILFLTDKDISRLSPSAIKDCCGHSALHEIYPKNGGVDKESWPCPPVIAKAIRAGQMALMAKAGGITAVEVTAKGLPVLLSAGGSLDLGGLTSLPANAKLSAGGSLGLGGLTSLPANAKLSAGGDLYLGGLTSLPANAKLSAGGDLYLSGLTSLPANAKLSAGGSLDLGGWLGKVKDAPREVVK